MRIQMTMAAIGLSVIGLWVSATGASVPVAAKAAVVAPVAAPAAESAPATSAEFSDVLARGGIQCHAPKRCCEYYPGSHTLCLNSAQCTAGPCP